MENESLLIIGTGALATFFAARLAAIGVAVSMLGTWEEGLAALNEKGARVDGENQAYRVNATADPVKCKGARFALVLLKAWQTERAAQQLSTCLAEDGIALTLQNGLGNDNVLSLFLGRERVGRGVTTLGVTLVAPGLVSLGGRGSISLERHPRLFLSEKMFTRAEMDVSFVDNVESLIWGKLVINSAINPLTALLHVKNGELLRNSFSHALMGELARETASVANSLGIALPFQNPEHAAEDVAWQTAENQSSMLQDVMRGVPTEINAINGAVISLAEEKNLPVPRNRTVWSLVKALPVHGKI
jgi:2-dehydropantoate 2-reductase